jgi:NAD(P)-dependent dehydrogenase (short-subunit alcohol dehydrogenase family)
MAGTILITGSSSGIGHFAAHGLKKRGWRVFAAARRHGDCVRLKEEGLETVRLDYDDRDSIAAALHVVLERSGGRLDALFNNGGYAQLGALEDLPTDLLRSQFETNVFGWHELTRRVIPVMRRQGFGRIVNCSSVLGLVAARYRGAYVASKFAVEGLTDTLRLELAGSGIAAILIEPGPIASRFSARAREQAAETLDIEQSLHAAAYREELARFDRGEDPSRRVRKGPEAVLAALVHAVESRNPKARYRVTLPTTAAMLIKRLLPTRLADRVLSGW